MPGEIPRDTRPCPGCRGTPDIWSDGHSPGCAHPRRYLAHPPDPMAVWAVLVTGDGGRYWMADTPFNIGYAIAGLDQDSGITGAVIQPVASPN